MRDTEILKVTATQELSKATIMRAEPDLLITRYRFDVVIDEADAEKIDEAHTQMCLGKEVFIIVDLQKGLTKISKEAEEFFTKKGKMVPYIKGVALVDNSKSSFFANFLLKLHNFIYPTKSFSNLEDAARWIDTQRKTVEKK